MFFSLAPSGSTDLVQIVRCWSGEPVVWSCDFLWFCFVPALLACCCSHLVGWGGSWWLAVFCHSCSDLAVCAQRTLQCDFRLFYLTCHWSADKERCCYLTGRRCSCLVGHLIIWYWAALSVLPLMLYACRSSFNFYGSLPLSQVINSFLFLLALSLSFFNITPLGKLHSADGWVTAAVVREHKVPAVHSFPRHCWKLLALRPALIFTPW